METIRTSISGPADLLERADERARSLGFRNFSAYVQQLIRADLHQAANSGDASLRLVVEQAAPYGKQGSSDSVLLGAAGKQEVKKEKAE